MRAAGAKRVESLSGSARSDASAEAARARTPKRVRFALAEPYTDDTWIAYDQNAEEIELEVVDG